MAKPVDLTPRRERDLFTSDNLNQPFTEMEESANQNDIEPGVRDGCFREQHLPSLLGNTTLPGTDFFGATSVSVTSATPQGSSGYDCYEQSMTDSTYHHWGSFDTTSYGGTRDDNGWIPMQDNLGNDIELSFVEPGAVEYYNGIDLRDSSRQNIEGVLVLFNCHLIYLNKDFASPASNVGETKLKDKVGFTLQFLSPAGPVHLSSWRPIGYSERYYERGAGNHVYIEQSGWNGVPGTFATEGEMFSNRYQIATDYAGWGRHHVDISIRILLTKDALLFGPGDAYTTEANGLAHPVLPIIGKIRPCICITPVDNRGPNAWNDPIAGADPQWGQNNLQFNPLHKLETQTEMKCLVKDLNLSAIVLQSGPITSKQ